jgi:beta-barrel assembly-enhancing protease
MAAVLVLLAITPILAQTPVKPPKNRYTPEQDVELGRKAAAEIRSQYPIIENAAIARYLTNLGDRLVEASPQELKQKVFEYSFTAVNLKEINAFALPGGPMFVHRGMFDAAASEGEVVGVMAHELSHVLLRHGTANASKAQNPWLQLGQLAGVIGGAVVGGGAGSAIAQTTQFGLGTLLLRYSRDFEKQADLLGSQIMARAGYDPRALARMFETIEKESKGGGPQWMSSHPNPGNRTAYITKEAAEVIVVQKADESRFPGIKETFGALPPAKSMAELARREGSTSDEAPKSVGVPGRPVPLPSPQYRSVSPGGIFEASVPNNWTSLASSQSVKFVPPNGYGELKVRGRPSGVTRPPRGHRHLAERSPARQSRDARRRRTGGHPTLAAHRPHHAARQPVAARRRRAHHPLYVVSQRRKPVLLPRRLARERCTRVRGGIRPRRPFDPPEIASARSLLNVP